MLGVIYSQPSRQLRMFSHISFNGPIHNTLHHNMAISNSNIIRESFSKGNKGHMPFKHATCGSYESLPPFTDWQNDLHLI